MSIASDQRTHRAPVPDESQGQLLDRLDSLLEDLDQAVAELDALTEQQRRALTRVDGRSMAELAEKHEHAIRRVRALDQRQRQLSRSHSVQPSARPRTITELAGQLEPADRARVLDRARQLADRLALTNRRSASLAQASASLIRHMQSLSMQVQASASTYAPTSAAAAARESHAPPRALDLRS